MEAVTDTGCSHDKWMSRLTVSRLQTTSCSFHFLLDTEENICTAGAFFPCESFGPLRVNGESIFYLELGIRFENCSQTIWIWSSSSSSTTTPNLSRWKCDKKTGEIMWMAEISEKKTFISALKYYDNKIWYFLSCFFFAKFNLYWHFLYFDSYSTIF